MLLAEVMAIKEMVIEVMVIEDQGHILYLRQRCQLSLPLYDVVVIKVRHAQQRSFINIAVGS